MPWRYIDPIYEKLSRLHLWQNFILFEILKAFNYLWKILAHICDSLPYKAWVLVFQETKEVSNYWTQQSVLPFADSCWSDEQKEFKCNTQEVGCPNVCFNAFAPINQVRLWSMQVLAITGLVTINFYAGLTGPENDWNILGFTTDFNTFNEILGESSYRPKTWIRQFYKHLTKKMIHSDFYLSLNQLTQQQLKLIF